MRRKMKIKLPALLLIAAVLACLAPAYSAAASQTFQAETATYTGATVLTEQSGYTGTGYVDFDAGSNSGAYIQWTVNAAAAGSHRLDFRYANGSADRPLRVTVNGAIIDTDRSFASTGGWTSWNTSGLIAYLNAGNNTIRITTIGANGANIDSLTVTSGSVAKPGASNTGPSNPSLIVPAGGSFTVTQNGAVIENIEIEGTITINANNVTLRNFRVKMSAGSHFGVRIMNGTGIVIEDGEIDGRALVGHPLASDGITAKNATVRRLNIHDMGGDGMKTGTGTVIESNWVRKVGRVGNDPHGDALQVTAGSNIVIRGNNFDVPSADRANAAIILKTDQGLINNVTVAGNWLNGGNYTVYSRFGSFDNTTPPTNVSFTGNRFGRDYKYGIKSFNGTVTWQNNVWDDNNQMIN